MAKIKAPAPKAPESPEVEGVQAPDLSGLIQTISGNITSLIEGENAAKSARLDIVVACREAREEHGEALERDAVRLAIQTAVAEGYGLKLTDVQNKPDAIAQNATKDAKERFAKRNSCYVLCSELLTMAWPKDEKVDKQVADAMAKGEERWTILKGMAQKKQARPAQDPDKNKITRENYATHLNAFFTKALTDIGTTLEDILDINEVALEAIKSAPKE